MLRTVFCTGRANRTLPRLFQLWKMIWKRRLKPLLPCTSVLSQTGSWHTWELTLLCKDQSWVQGTLTHACYNADFVSEGLGRVLLLSLWYEKYSQSLPPGNGAFGHFCRLQVKTLHTHYLSLKEEGRQGLFLRHLSSTAKASWFDSISQFFSGFQWLHFSLLCMCVHTVPNALLFCVPLKHATVNVGKQDS